MKRLSEAGFVTCVRNGAWKGMSSEELEKEAWQLAKDNDCPFVDNETPYGRAKKGHPVIVDYFYHEEVRGSNNTGKRNRK